MLGFKSFSKLILPDHYGSVFLFSCTSYINFHPHAVDVNYIIALTYRFTFIKHPIRKEANEYLRSHAMKSQISCILYFLAHFSNGLVLKLRGQEFHSESLPG